MKSKLNNSLFALFITIIIMPGCIKDSSNQPALMISSISPAHGGGSAQITIIGAGFSSVPDKNDVFFNGKKASVVNASSTQLVVAVPPLAGTGIVTATVGGLTASGPVFTYDTSYAVEIFARTGLRFPQYIAMDGSNNLYVTNYDGSVTKISSNGATSTLISGLSNPRGIAIDKSGNIFVATTNMPTASIIKINSAGDTTLVASFRGFLYGLTIDKNDNLYVANTAEGTVNKITPDGSVTTHVKQLIGVVGLRAGSGGNIFATGTTNGAVYKITATGVVYQLAGSFGFTENDLIVDDNENVYVTVFGNGSVAKIASDKTISTVALGFKSPVGITKDQNGNFYVVNRQDSGFISKMIPQ